VISWIVQKQQPFTAAEEQSFGNMFKLFNENPKMMSNDTVSRRIFCMYDEEKHKLKTTLQVC
jgi:hypothetical protein